MPHISLVLLHGGQSICEMQDQGQKEACAVQLGNAGLASHSPGGAFGQVRSHLKSQLAL